ncbi:hypothetical protein MGN70_011590 [Eutypa lata]|nr:hypothetical protein MGN70_011590 [Eutypa lata]
MSLHSTRKTAPTNPNHDVDTIILDAASPDSPSGRNKLKRTRISRACDQCRVEKEKCEGERPCCQTCVAAGRRCTYAREQKKRGPRTGSVRAVERTLAWIFDAVPGAEERTAAMLASGEQARRLLLDKTSEDHERLHQKWVNCRVNRRIQLLLSGVDITSASDKEGGSLEEDDSVVQDAVPADSQETRAEPYSKPLPPQKQRPPKDQQPPQDLWTPQISPFESTETQSGSTAPPRIHCSGTRGDILCLQPRTTTLPANYDRLLQIYHSYTYCWFPLADYSRFYNTVAQYPLDGGLVIDPLNPLSADHAELWGALALAAFQEASAARTYGNRHNMVSSPPTSPQEIYATARSLIPNEDGACGLGHIHALLLLAMINIGQSNNHRSYMLVGMAIRLALTLNLHESAADDQQFFRKQYAIAGCFILETLVCAILGRIRHLKSSHLRSQLPFQADLPDEYQAWTPCPAMDTRGDTGCATYSPAQSYSAFAQIYRFFRLLDYVIEQPVQDPNQALMALAESVDYGYSSCNSIVPASSAMLAVPSTFLVHATFLTVAICMKTSRTTSQLFLLLELLETHISTFGSASSSPLLVGYMNLGGSLHLFESIGNALTTRWDSVAAMFRAVWTGEKSLYDNPSQGPAVTWSQQSQGDTHMKSLPHISEVTAGAETDPVHHTLNSFRSPSMGRRSTPDPALQTVEFNNQSDNTGGMHTASTGPEFDAALAEIAEIDPFDSMDAQNEFLANLGFGPGVNLNELLGADVDFAL